MAANGSLSIRILGDSGPLEKTLKGVGGKLGSFVKKVGAAGALAVGAIAAKGIQAAREATKINNLTEQVLKSTKGAAKVSFEEIEKLNSALQATSGVSDEVIQEGQNLLLTFTNIRNEVGAGNDIFNQATEAALDMSVALGQDIKSGAIQLGKALNDPIKGVSALTRVGVSFTEQQKEQIKTLAESGDMLGAQKIILGELETQFGGAAAAAADPLQKLQATIGDVVETVGMALLPAFDAASTWLAERLPGAIAVVMGWINDNLVPAFQRLGDWWDQNSPAVLAAAQQVWEGLRAAFDKIVQAVGFVMEHWDKFKVAIGVAVAVMIPHWVALGVAATVSAGKQAAAWVKTQLAAIKSVLVHSAQVAVMVAKWVFVGAQSLLHAGKVAAAWLIAMGPIGLVVAAVVAGVALIVANWDKVKAAATAVKDWIVEKFDALVAFVTELPGRIAEAASGMWDGIKDAFKSAVNWIIRKWNDLQLRVGGGTFDLPGPLGSITIPSITLDTPNIPLLAKGGTALSAGLAIVGERGPELAYMNRGATIQPLSGRSGGGVNINIDAPNLVVGDERAFRDMLQRSLLDALVKQNRIGGPIPIQVRG